MIKQAELRRNEKEQTVWKSEVGVCFSKIHRFGFYGREDTPGPISNPAVKLSSADDSVKAKIGQSRIEVLLTSNGEELFFLTLR